MPDTAFQTQYRQEFIAGYEQTQSYLRDSVTTEAVFKGNQATFLIADSGGAEAVTRGVNGLIPARADNLTQATATLEEFHDLPKKTGFNIFASQSDQRRIMQQTSYGVMNRKVDQQILSVLATGTNDTGAATTGSLNLVMYALTILENNVASEDEITFVISSAMRAYLVQAKEFSSVDYLASKTFDSKMRRVFMWGGMRFIVHPNIPGKGTNAEKCFAFSKSAVGHALDKAGLQMYAGYNEEQDYSFHRVTGYMGATLLQNAGVVVINHDGSNFAAQ